jgi:aspartate 1-decarboxylase
LTTDGAPLTTFQLDTVDYTGTIAVQGATAATANTVEWYNISFEDLKNGNTVSELTFVEETARRGINVEGYHPYIRLEFGISNGNVDLITYR